MAIQSVAIIGGGITGISCGYYLAKTVKDIEIDIYEKLANVGGLASAYQLDSYQIDKLYHHLFPTDQEVIETAQKIGFTGKIQWFKSSISFYYDGKVYPFTTPKDLLLFRPLSLKDRIRLGLGFLRSKNASLTSLDQSNAVDYYLSQYGEKITNKIFLPLLKVKFGQNFDEISTAFVMGRFKARAKSRSKTGKEHLGYILPCFSAFISELAEKFLLFENTNIFTNAEIVAINKLSQNGFSVKISQSESIHNYDVIIGAIQLPILIKIAQTLFEPYKEYRQKLERIKYHGVICVLFGFTEPLGKYYWNNINDSTLTIGGIIEQTRFVPKSAYDNETIVYAFKYSSVDDPTWQLSNKGIRCLFYDDLKKVFKEKVEKNSVIWTRVGRFPLATPVFSKGYLAVVPEIRSPVRNFYVSGSHNVFPYSRTINTGIKIALKVIKILLEDNPELSFNKNRKQANMNASNMIEGD